MLHAIRGLPASGARFLRGMDFDPPRATTRARVGALCDFTWVDWNTTVWPQGASRSCRLRDRVRGVAQDLESAEVAARLVGPDVDVVRALGQTGGVPVPRCVGREGLHHVPA